MFARRLLAGSCWLCLFSCAEPEETQGGPEGSAASGTGGAAVTGGTASGGAVTGGTTTGGIASGAATTGGVATGGAVTGGVTTGGIATGGAVTGGAETGGLAPGGTSSGGSDTGGSAAGGADTGGSDTGGAATGGTATGGAPAGGAETGGDAAGGAETGGDAAGGTATGGASTGGAETGGDVGSGGTAGSVGCDRAGLQAAVDAYLAAMAAGDPSLLPLAASATYEENAEAVALGQGLWATPLHADLTLSLLDVSRCASFTEVIIASGSHDYVNGVRIDVSDGLISAISVIATDADDWGFNGDTYLNYSSQEVEGGGWDEVPEAERYGYDELVAAGEAYFAFWADKTVAVPWGVPCARLEGGMYTGYRAGADCSVGIPDQSFAPRPNDALADVDRGLSVIFLNLPGPDSHLFRVQKTYPNMESPGIRYVHTLTVCYVNGEWQCPGEPPTG